MISLSINRAGLSKPALTFVDNPASGLWIPENGLGRPGTRWRRKYVESDNLHGSLLLQATREHSSIPATLYVQADTTAALHALMDDVEEALGQFFYPVTLTVDGVSDTYNADPADVDWGTIDSGMVKAYMASTQVTIPVYPIASA